MDNAEWAAGSPLLCSKLKSVTLKGLSLANQRTVTPQGLRAPICVGSAEPSGAR